MTQQLSEPDPLVGQTVAGKFKIVKLLGEGGMGCVYLAEQQLGTNVRKVALKTLHKHLSQDQHIKERFNREAGTVSGLEHPNTIQVFDFGEMPDGTLYLVMEYVQGRSVADWLEKDGAMPPQRVEHIMRQVCGSLEEAHGHGIIHRDLKPDNVVLCERAGQKDWVEVLDFGIAKRSSEHDPNEAKLTQQGMVLGTPPYMSPEQFTGQPIDARSDIYALGVMAYEMLTGRLPFEANTAWEWASKHMTEPPRPIETQPLGPNVPDKMRAAITRALAKNKEERFANVKEFFEAFSGGVMHTAVITGDQGVASAPRAKTEMAQPAMVGPMAGAITPGPMPASPPMGPAVVPAGPMHQGAPQQKKGGAGLIIGLGGLAAVLLIGAGVFALMHRGPKPVPTVPTTDTAVATTPSLEPSASAVPDVPVTVATVEPLASAATAVIPATHAGGGGGGKTPVAKPIPTPSIKQEPAKPDPPICVQARGAAARHSPVAAKLEAQCIAAGGKL
jgi:tRNA A-37 threonylcarbamoyl transferase component Bud32